MRTKVTLDTETTLYLLEIDMEEEGVVLKIGITTRKIQDRVAEILASGFNKYRVFFRCYPKRYRKVPNAYEIEQWLLDYCKEYKYTPKKKYQGNTEMVKMDLEVLVNKYEEVIEKGLDNMIMNEWEKCECGLDKKFILIEKDREVRVCGNMACREKYDNEKAAKEAKEVYNEANTRDGK